VHEELDVEEWAFRYIIGSKGSEMKHIQHNWKVTVAQRMTLSSYGKLPQGCPAPGGP
jgi:hypothetical protein